MALYNLVALDVAPMAFLRFLLCRMSRTMIMTVRRTLSERETEKVATPKLAMAAACEVMASDRVVR